jgi:ABC-type phosphate/phosphonate transport system permease subunit
MNPDNLQDILALFLYLGLGLWVGRLFSEKWAQRLFRIETIALVALLFLCVPFSIAVVVHPDMPVILRLTVVIILIASVLALLVSFCVGLGFVSRPSLRRVGFQVLRVAILPLLILWCLAMFSTR